MLCNMTLVECWDICRYGAKCCLVFLRQLSFFTRHAVDVVGMKQTGMFVIVFAAIPKTITQLFDGMQSHSMYSVGQNM